MNIKFNNLVIQDFKGIKNEDIPLKQNHLFYGPNASFKTSKLDSITWVLYGKNIENSQQFGFIPIGEGNAKKEEYDLKVKLSLSINNKDYIFEKTISRKLSEKHKSGYVESKTFRINDEILTATLYKNRVDSLIGLSEQEMMSFMLPTYILNSLDPKSARKLFAKTTKDITDTSILLEVDKKFNDKSLIEDLRKKLIDVEFEELESSSVEQIKTEKNELMNNQNRLLEKQNWLKENKFESVENIDGLKKELDEWNEKLKNYTSNIKLKNDRSTLSNEIEILKEKINHIKSQTFGINDDKINTINNNILSLKNKNIQNSNEYLNLKEKKIETNCPVCNAKIEESKLQQTRDNLEKELAKFKQIGLNYEEEIEKLEQEKTQLEKDNNQVVDNDKLDKLNNELNSKNDEFEELTKYKGFYDDDVATPEKANDNIQRINQSIGNYSLIDKTKTEIAELESKILKLEKTILKHEKELDLIKLFVSTKIQMLENKVSHLFKISKIKLFKKQENGILKPIFSLYDKNSNADFQDTNNGQKIRGQVELSVALQKLKGVNTPIILDKAEELDKLDINISQQLICAKVKHID